MPLKNFQRNAWYVAAWSSEVGQSGVLDRTILGDHIIAYRTADGDVVAMRNRCPHRSAPLSAGRREGDAIRCGYHGMLFGSDGRCIGIPGSDVIPRNADVRSYPVVERNGWIWIWPGDATRADTAMVPAIAAFDQPDWKWKTGYIGYKADAQLLHDNLLDFSHLEFVHANTLGGGANWADKPEVSKIDGGLHIERWMTGAEPAPFLRSVVPQGVRHDILNVYDFLLPGVLLIDTTTQNAGSGTREMPDPESRMRLVSQQAVTPATDTTSHYFFAAMAPQQTPDPILDIFMQGTMAAFEEDRLMIEAQQALLSAEQDEPISRVALPADGPLVQFRGMLRKMLRPENSAEADGSQEAATMAVTEKVQ